MSYTPPFQAFLKTWQALLVSNGLLAVLYVIAAQLGLSVAFVASSVTLVWPPSGIGLAALLLGGYWLLPGLVLGAFTANVLSGASYLFALGTAIGNPLEAALGAYLLYRFCDFRPTLDRLRDVVSFIGCGVVVAPVASATIGVFSLCLSGGAEWSVYGGIWGGWWLGDAMGIFIVTPALLTLFLWRHLAHRPARLGEAMAFFVVFTGISLWVFLTSTSYFGTSWPLAYLAFPLLIVAAFRYHTFGATQAMLISNIVAVVGTLRHTGPFGSLPAYEGLVMLLSFLAVVALTSLILAAVVAERNEAQASLTTLNTRLEQRVRQRTEDLAQEVTQHRATEATLKRAVRRAETLHQLSSVFLSARSVQDVFNAALDKAVHALETDRVTLFHLDVPQQTILGAYRAGPGQHLVADVDFDELWEGLTGWVLREGRPALSQKNEPDHREAHGVESRRQETHCGSIIVVPIRLPDRMIGTMTAIQTPDAPNFTQQDVELLVAIANHVALALSNLHLLDSLRDSEVRFRSAFRYAAIGMALAGLDGRWLKVNRAICDLLGYDAETLYTLDFQTITHPDDLNDDLALVQDLVSGRRRSYQLEKRYLHREGHAVWTLLSVSVVRHADGTALYLISQIQDITQRKQAEFNLREHAEALERINRELEQFAYVTSHDLQEPLRTITSYVTLLDKRHRDALSEEAQTMMGFVKTAAEHMRSLIHDLLTYSRTGHTLPATAPVDAQAILTTVQNTLQATLHETQASLTSTPLPEVLCNPMALTLLLQNLISNALKFRGDTRPAIHVSAQQVDGAWRFGVHDNGIGIAPDHHDRIFKIFQRLHNRSTYPGTGIGLAICKKITDQWGGRIWVDPDVSSGSTFYFTVPDRMPSAAPTSSAPPRPPSAMPRPGWRGSTQH